MQKWDIPQNTFYIQMFIMLFLCTLMYKLMGTFFTLSSADAMAMLLLVTLLSALNIKKRVQEFVLDAKFFAIWALFFLVYSLIGIFLFQGVMPSLQVVFLGAMVVPLSEYIGQKYNAYKGAKS